VVEPDKRRAILDAALSLFVERGFHGTAVPLVAERAGVAAGTIYRYFDSKEDLVNQLYRELKLSLAASVGDALPARATARERFHAFWRGMLDWALAHPEGYAFLEFHSHAAYLDDESRAVQRKTLEAGLSMIESAQRAGAYRPGPPMLLASVMLGALAGVVRARWEGELEPSDETLALAEQACWDAIAARGG